MCVCVRVCVCRGKGAIFEIISTFLDLKLFLFTSL